MKFRTLTLVVLTLLALSTAAYAAPAATAVDGPEMNEQAVQTPATQHTAEATAPGTLEVVLSDAPVKTLLTGATTASSCVDGYCPEIGSCNDVCGGFGFCMQRTQCCICA